MNINEIRNSLRSRASVLNIKPSTTTTVSQAQVSDATMTEGNLAVKPVADSPTPVKAPATKDSGAVDGTTAAGTTTPVKTRRGRKPKAAVSTAITASTTNNSRPVEAVEPVEAIKAAGAASTEANAADAKAEVSPTLPSALEPIESIIAKHLVMGRDFDIIPGCKKPSLLKPGAEKLIAIYGYTTQTEVLHRVEIWDKSFVLYEIQVTISDKTGKVVSQGIGSCNSRERKYLRGDFATQLNTVLKMAKKRAYVDAALTACGASGVFTQDVEDILNQG